MARIKNYDAGLASGDVAKMQQLYNSWIKAANERIRVTTQEKHVSGAQAYNYIVQPLTGSPYVKENARGTSTFRALGKKATEGQIREAFHALTRFLGSKTSTVAGIKEVRETRIKNLDETLGDAAGGLSNDEKERILRFLGSPAGVEAKQQFDSDQIVTALALEMKNNRGADVLGMWRAWEARQETLADWIGRNEGREMEL